MTKARTDSVELLHDVMGCEAALTTMGIDVDTGASGPDRSDQDKHPEYECPFYEIVDTQRDSFARPGSHKGSLALVWQYDTRISGA